MAFNKAQLKGINNRLAILELMLRKQETWFSKIEISKETGIIVTVIDQCIWKLQALGVIVWKAEPKGRLKRRWYKLKPDSSVRDLVAQYRDTLITMPVYVKKTIECTDKNSLDFLFNVCDKWVRTGHARKRH